MSAIAAFYAVHPFWTWIAVAAVLLAAEVVTGWGYLLWPAAAAVGIAVAGRFAPLGLPVEVAVFVVLTIASTMLARRFLPRHAVHGAPAIKAPAEPDRADDGSDLP
jgi:membrane protein implicated in regulation of membrane protease activity